MSGTEPERPELERTVEDNYIIYVQRDATKPRSEADAERLRRFQTLLERAEQLRQQYGAEKFSYRRFEYLKAVAAVIKDNSIIETLKSEGYGVEKQGIMRAQGIERPRP